jgi:hypothetical protein
VIDGTVVRHDKPHSTGGRKLFAGIVLGATLVVAGLMLIHLGKAAFSGEKHFVGVGITGVATAVAIAVIVFNFASENGDSDSRFLKSNISLGDAVRAASLLGPPGPMTTTTAGRGVASVPSLIEGLERRLDAEPENASGWALLAQSYAFVGRTEETETALQHAVELGLDEQDLRLRVADARREPHNDMAINSVR